jgi:hypothetical protein
LHCKQEINLAGLKIIFKTCVLEIKMFRILRIKQASFLHQAQAGYVRQPQLDELFNNRQSDW